MCMPLRRIIKVFLNYVEDNKKSMYKKVCIKKSMYIHIYICIKHFGITLYGIHVHPCSHHSYYSYHGRTNSRLTLLKLN